MIGRSLELIDLEFVDKDFAAMATTHWYCWIGNHEYGPYTWEQVQQFVAEQRLTAADFVRQGQQGEWQPASQFADLFPPAPAKAPLPKAAPAPARRANAANPINPAAPAHLPVGRPVAVQPAASLPVGTAVSVAPIVTAPTRSAAHHDDDDDPADRRSAKQKQQMMLIGGLGGAIALLAIIAIVVFALPGDSDKQTARGNHSSPAAEANAESDIANSPADTTESAKNAEGNPEADPVEADPVESVNVAAKNKNALAEQPVAVPKVGRWMEAGRQKGGLRGIVKLHVASAWLESGSGESASPRLVLEIQVTNQYADKPLPFRGWRANKAAGAEAAMLLGPNDQPLALLDAAAPDSAIAAGRDLTARLTFAAPAGDFDKLRLFLPYTAIGQTGHAGFEIARATIADAKPAPASVAAAVARPATADSAVGELAAESLAADGPPAAEPAESEPPPPDNANQPATIDALRKQIQGIREEEKKAKKPPVADGEPPAETEPAAGDQPDSIDDLRKQIEAGAEKKRVDE